MKSKEHLPTNPTLIDLWDYCKINLKKSRNVKKFKKSPERYVRKEIWLEYQTKRLANAICEPIRKSLEYNSIGKKILMIDELPEITHARYEQAISNVYSEIITNLTVPIEFMKGQNNG